MTVIDAHQHFWNPQRVPYPWLGPDLPLINRPIEFDELTPNLEQTGVDATVLVQSADNAADTEYMFEVASRHPEIAAIVAWVPLDQPGNASTMLDELRTRPGFAGIRNLIHNQPDEDWLLREDVGEGLALLAAHDVPFDVVAVTSRHLEHVPVLSERHPDLRMVIDHLAKPPIKGSGWEPWKTLITRAAQNPRVYAKVSGLYPEAGDLEVWNADDIKPFVDFAMEVFGPERLMYGGDWPISLMAGGYLKVWNALTSIFETYTAGERTALLAETAIDFYGIGPERLAAAQR